MTTESKVDFPSRDKKPATSSSKRSTFSSLYSEVVMVWFLSVMVSGEAIDGTSHVGYYIDIVFRATYEFFTYTVRNVISRHSAACGGYSAVNVGVAGGLASPLVFHAEQHLCDSYSIVKGHSRVPFD
jgi:hypothetical protein